MSPLPLATPNMTEISPVRVPPPEAVSVYSIVKPLFGNGGATEVYLSSADWMERNFFSRVEICFPVTRAALRRRLAADLELELRDNQQTWEMQPDGSYVQRVPGPGEDARGTHAVLVR
jgi:polyphosphate kinase